MLPRLRRVLLSCLVLVCCTMLGARYFSVETIYTIGRQHIVFNTTTRFPTVYAVSLQHALPPSSEQVIRGREYQDFVVNRSSELEETVTNRRLCGGFVLALSYYDQVTCATRRLFKMHEWAAALNLTVVEPFILRSMLGLNEMALDPSGTRKVARFGDMYTIEDWNRFIASSQVHSRMASWDEFLNCAPRNIIYIQVNHRGPGLPFAGNLPIIHSCISDEVPLSFLSVHGFFVSNSFCVTIDRRHKTFSEEDFISSFLQEYTLRNSTIIFSTWRAIGFYPTKVKFSDLNFTAMAKMVSYSSAVIKSVETYTKKYLVNKRYVAIMLRAEQALLRVKMNKAVALSQCISHIITKWSEMKNEHNIQSTILSMDVGEFGSNLFRVPSLQQKELRSIIESFISELLGKDMNFENWEQSFVDACPGSVPGIVATVQKVLAAQSTCLILAGGGHFQLSVQELYKYHHSDNETCLVALGDCVAH